LSLSFFCPTYTTSLCLILSPSLSFVYNFILFLYLCFFNFVTSILSTYQQLQILDQTFSSTLSLSISIKPPIFFPLFISLILSFYLYLSNFVTHTLLVGIYKSSLKIFSFTLFISIFVKHLIFLLHFVSMYNFHSISLSFGIYNTHTHTHTICMLATTNPPSKSLSFIFFLSKLKFLPIIFILCILIIFSILFLWIYNTFFFPTSSYNSLFYFFASLVSFYLCQTLNLFPLLSLYVCFSLCLYVLVFF
jgi:hypothetical protein